MYLFDSNILLFYNKLCKINCVKGANGRTKTNSQTDARAYS